MNAKQVIEKQDPEALEYIKKESKKKNNFDWSIPAIIGLLIGGGFFAAAKAFHVYSRHAPNAAIELNSALATITPQPDNGINPATGVPYGINPATGMPFGTMPIPGPTGMPIGFM